MTASMVRSDTWSLILSYSLYRLGSRLSVPSSPWPVEGLFSSTPDSGALISDSRFSMALLLHDIFPYVDGNRKDDNETADDVLDIRVDPQELQSIHDSLHDNSTDDNALDSTDAA